MKSIESLGGLVTATPEVWEMGGKSQVLPSVVGTGTAVVAVVVALAVAASGGRGAAVAGREAVVAGWAEIVGGPAGASLSLASGGLRARLPRFLLDVGAPRGGGSLA